MAKRPAILEILRVDILGWKEMTPLGNVDITEGINSIQSGKCLLN